MQLINALVTSPDDLDFRIHLRNEVPQMWTQEDLAGSGLVVVVVEENTPPTQRPAIAPNPPPARHLTECGEQELKETEELDIQLKVFNENKEEDAIELSHRLDDIRAEMEYPFSPLPLLLPYLLSPPPYPPPPPFPSSL
ncbi:hypothetical protein CRUP_003572 [Coryphaenoides rupestris]|nr:hypothetical protein CRUP_003572 [Coryphaenoides rupestris]